MASASASGDGIARAAALVRAARAVVVFTGAGISTESGIPDFRSPGGIWSRFDPLDFTYDRFISSAEARARFWRMGRELGPVLRDAVPNAGHFAIAAAMAAGRVGWVVTQNIDGLHQKAGCAAERVLELHGTAHRARCLDCEKEWTRDAVEAWLAAGVADPRCDACGGIVKPRTVAFGEPMPARETAAAFAQAGACDLLLTVGTSLQVYPAAELVPSAKAAGARLVIVNLEPTDYDGLADAVVRGKAGDVLPQILQV